MKQLRFSTLLVAFILVAACGETSVKEEKKDDLRANLLLATDLRDKNTTVFQTALSEDKYIALSLMGQVGDSLCKDLVPYFSDVAAEARYYAAMGAAYCHDEKLSEPLLAAFNAEQDLAIKQMFAVALGYSGGDKARMPLFDAYSELGEAGLLGIIQSVAYSRVSASEIQLAPFGELLDLTQDESVGYAAAYALGRINGLDSMLEFSDVTNAVKAAPSIDTKIALMRTVRQFGNTASPFLLSMLVEQPKALKLGVISALGQLTDDASKEVLFKLVEDEDAHVRHGALSALSNRQLDDPTVEAILDNALANGTRWDKVSAMAGILKRDEKTATRVAASWLAGDDYYLAFQGLIILSGSDAGRVLLEEYAENNPNSVRGYEASVALDPSVEADTIARPSPSVETTDAYVRKKLILTTTRGDVVIEMVPEAPFAATSFLQAAEQGKLDGMLWHRVIPNFVSQAGQKEDTELYKWGSIREEWGGAHKIGTVGVATAGRDTGSTQFFINTAYNMHLNGRYTVFGEVVSDMNVVYDLQEGDEIIKATISD